jgi:hypothetical protein
MKVKNKLTPYPILYAYNDNYLESSFTVDIQANCIFGEVYISIDFVLNNVGLQKLIDDNKACFTVHIECPSTSYRTKIDSKDINIELKLDSKDLKDKIEVCTFIIATDDIIDYQNEKFHYDYHDYKFNIERGNILAIGIGKEFTIQKNNNDLENLPSIMKIFKKTDVRGGTISVDTDDSDYILIGVCEELFEKYYSLGKNKFKHTILSLVLLPALVIVLTRMKYADDDEKDKKWFNVIESLLNSNDIEVEDLDIQNKEKSVLTVAQMIFSDPINRSFDELESIITRG